MFTTTFNVYINKGEKKTNFYYA